MCVCVCVCLRKFNTFYLKIFFVSKTNTSKVRKNGYAGIDPETGTQTLDHQCLFTKSKHVNHVLFLKKYVVQIIFMQNKISYAIFLRF